MKRKIRKTKRKKRNKKILLKSFLFLLSLGIIPLFISLVMDVPVLFNNYKRFTPEILFSTAGFLIFVVVFLLFGPPVKSYILEHELSHVLFAFMSGVKIKSVSIRKNEGYVRTEKINMIIALAPYSFPLYTIALIAFYKILKIFFLSSVLSGIFYFVIGVSLSFHVIATIHYVQIDQPDMKRYGYFSSLVFIFTWSLIVAALTIALMFENVEIIDYFTKSFTHTYEFYERLFMFF
ncbi:MAG TPA: hypothetical protein ENI15_08115 [Spirochaetes bacterium]|nr:hypothetical protein [Spirochaetota bacterium]